jgi:hypothetical protein
MRERNAGIEDACPSHFHADISPHLEIFCLASAISFFAVEA